MRCGICWTRRSIREDSPEPGSPESFFVETRTMSLLEVTDLRVHLFTNRGVVPAVDGVSFSLSAGQALGIVGESGCGKTMTALSLMRLLPSPPARVVAGSIRFQDEDVLAMDPDRLRNMRGGAMAMIYQDPQTSLNPVFSIG